MKVSVVVPVRNEEGTLAALLDSLLAQAAPPDEIVVADGGSTDGTADRARAYADRMVRLLEIGPAYPGRGRNAGIRAARNDWVALVDGGCTADPGWLENLVAAAWGLDSGARVIFGEQRPRLATEWDVAKALAFVAPPDPATGARPPSIASSLIHREAWSKVGGFPEHLRAAEDLLFMDRLREAGVPVARSPKAVVYWQLAAGPLAVYRRFRLYSAHHLAAGLFRTWHLKVMSMDCIALALLTLVGVSPFFLIPLLSGMVARLLRTVARRRHNVSGRWPFRPDRLLRVAGLLALADAATWLGALDYAIGREPPR